MDIDSYIDLHQAEWRDLEAAVQGGTSALEKLSGNQIKSVVSSYLRVSGHLSEVRARYRDPRLEDYLNRLVARANVAIYSAGRGTRRGFLSLFGDRYRAALRGTRPYILVSAILFLGVMLATQLWIAGSSEARAGLLPPLAEEAVRNASGDRAAFGIPSAGISTYILVNNVQVALLAFASGILLGVGTLWLLIQNATFIGLLAGAFQAGGKAWTFWQLVLPHGLLEITAICIAAGAGLRMGWSIIAPGTRTRTRSLAEESADSALVVIGIIPAFVIAAIIEGFITGTEIPSWVELAIGTVAAVSYWLFLAGPRRVKAVPGSLR